MPTAMGYVWNATGSPNGLQMFKIAQNAFPSGNVKYSGGIVAFKIPTGYARTGAYIRAYTETSEIIYAGLCTYDNIGDRAELDYYNETGSWVVIFYGDTGEAVVYTSAGNFFLFMELLKPTDLTPIGYMVIRTLNNYGVFTTSSNVVGGYATPIYPDPIKVGDTIKVSRVYFFTPIGVATTRRLYSGLQDKVRYSLNVQIGNRKYIQLGHILVDVTDATEVVYYM
jgi:hypothetical protein